MLMVSRLRKHRTAVLQAIIEYNFNANVIFLCNSGSKYVTTVFVLN